MSAETKELVISADSHVYEDCSMWEERLTGKFKAIAPKGTQPKPGEPDTLRFMGHPGGWDPVSRIEEMQIDGVDAEILYPSYGMALFSLTDSDLQEACFVVYNDYLRDFCSVAPERLLPIPCLSTWDIDRAVKELERCHSLGDPGAAIWLDPPAELSFAGSHYDALWEAAEALEMPISCHAATGISYPWGLPPGVKGKSLDKLGRGVNSTIYAAQNALSDMLLGGALERFPRLKIILAECESSWIPFYLGKWDHSYKRYETTLGKSSLSMKPSEYFARQVYTTFITDPTLGSMLNFWGSDHCMWSNDFPHANSSWPSSMEIIEKNFSEVAKEPRSAVLSRTAMNLYPSLKNLTPLEEMAS